MNALYNKKTLAAFKKKLHLSHMILTSLSESDNIILVTCEFEGPEANVESERRVMEICPVFAESCYLVSASIGNRACP